MSEALCSNPRCRGDRKPRPVDGDAWLCRVCVDRLRQSIAEAPALITWLEQHVEPGRHGESDKVRGTRDAPVPIRVDVLAVTGPAAREVVHGKPEDQDFTLNIPAELDSWCRVVAEERGLHGSRNGKPETTANFLLAHLDWIVEQQWCIELLAEMQRMHNTAHALAPWTAGRHEVPGECPSCDLKALVRYDGSGYIECEPGAGGCGRLITEDDYQFLVRVLVNEQQEAS